MQRLLSIFFAGVVLPFIAAGSDVLELTDDDFESTVKEQGTILIEFFAPWCGHCKRLAPEYEQAATKLKYSDPPVPLAKVDCTEHKKTCEKYGVSGFPTLKIFRNGEASADYNGPREADGIVKYMRGQVGPSSRELKTLKELDKFIDNEEHSVIGFFEKETRIKDSFHKVADTERDRFRFAHTSAKEILDKYGFTDDIVVFHPKRLHNKFEESKLQYTGNYDTEKIKKFLESDMQGLCGHRTSDNADSFERPVIVVYYNVDYVKDPKGTNYWRNRVLKVAKDFVKQAKFAISNKEDYVQELEEFGLGDKKDETKPIVAGHGSDGGKYPMYSEFSMDNLRKFAEDFLAEKVDTYMKSESVPDNTNQPVMTVVGRNFKEIVNQDKDVLIEFYAPWCGHCKKLAPIFDELGDKMKDEDVVIAKMDATANDVPTTYQVQGFPTIYWSPKGKKKSPVVYPGGRELDDFVKYIAKEASSPLKGFSRDGKKLKKAKKDEI
jgi:protein disulfide isomerase family A protein 3